MSDPRDLTRYFAHVPYVVAQVYLGVYIVLLGLPAVVFAFDSNSWLAAGPGFYQELFNTYLDIWNSFFGDASAAQLLLFLFLLWPLGALVSEAGFRVGKLTRYHDDFNLDVGAPPHSMEHFRFRSQLLAGGAELRLWDWQNFQFNFFYYMEIVMGLLFLALSIAIIRPLFVTATPSDLVGEWLYLAVSTDVAIFILFWLMRGARIQKLEDFRRTHQSVKAILAERTKSDPATQGPASTDPTTPVSESSRSSE